MSSVPLDYAPPARRWRFPWRAVRIALLVAIVLPLLWTAYGAATNCMLDREAARLIKANAPARVWPSLSLAFTPTGLLLLPDGTPARLAEAPANNPSVDVATPLAETIAKFRAKQVGYTVVRHDRGGTTVVQVWALSPSAYLGICGNSSYAERRRASMCLWRNVGAFLAERGTLPGDPQNPREPISVIGW